MGVATPGGRGGGKHRLAGRLGGGGRAKKRLAATPRVRVVGNVSSLFPVDAGQASHAPVVPPFDLAAATTLMQGVISASIASTGLSGKAATAATVAATAAATAAAGVLFADLQHRGIAVSSASPPEAQTKAGAKRKRGSAAPAIGATPSALPLTPAPPPMERTPATSQQAKRERRQRSQLGRLAPSAVNGGAATAAAPAAAAASSSKPTPSKVSSPTGTTP